MLAIRQRQRALSASSGGRATRIVIFARAQLRRMFQYKASERMRRGARCAADAANIKAACVGGRDQNACRPRAAC
ncbi:hypothetical protein EVAR_28571_1 [Eumeta japonica]|uniref:Uncharacterized protein n=1 Tax=Eumeta variegata TaxID=151549 RepID=A0A4C1UXG1_EUMVA|nr:hypothetical protein EVAR_28571_1 [Eumeta japonica]